MTAPIGEELQALALTLAYEHAAAVIECNCVSVSDEVGAAGWYELPAAPEMDDCVRFLEMRGLLVRHALRPDWVSILDESEAAQ